jgi:outer membrane protein OmpA-like peptidoglycan-associated protein
MNRISAYATGAAAAALILIGTTGCTSKKYVRSQTQPVIQQTNELDQATAGTQADIRDTDRRAQEGIQQSQNLANQAQQNAQNAQQAANGAQQSAQDAVNRADTLQGVIANLDTYHQMADVQVHFGFNKTFLTKADRAQLDQFAAQLASTNSYILEVTGGTDSVGSKQYNYGLSDRRAMAVVQYLASKYNIPPHKFYLVGLGKDQEVATNRTATGRADNRRVEIQLLSNQGSAPTQTGQASASTGSGTGAQ